VASDAMSGPASYQPSSWPWPDVWLESSAIHALASATPRALMRWGPRIRVSSRRGSSSQRPLSTSQCHSSVCSTAKNADHQLARRDIKNPKTPVLGRALANTADLRTLPVAAVRHTLYDMKTAAVTIRLDAQLEELLDEVCRQTGQSRSEVVRDALRRQLTLRLFEEARRKVIPFAEARGIYTDEDVFKLMS
jgi:predicted transcriptional regulator